MTTSPGQEPRPGASRGGSARSRREADPGSPPSGGAERPRFVPSRAPERDGGRSPREPRPQGGYGERAGGGRHGGREFRDRTDSPDSPRRPADRDATRVGVGRGPRDSTGRGPRDGTGRGPRDGTRGSPREGTGRGPRDGGRGSPREGTGRGAPNVTGRSPREGTRSSREGTRRPGESARVPREGTRGTRGGADRGGPRSGVRQESALGELRAGPALRWIGTFPLKLALIIFFGASVLGALATLVTRSSPGGMLGGLILLGAVVAALGIEQRSLYLLMPVPALTYLVLALVTGAIHDRAADTSTTQFGLNFLQWIGNGFLWLCAAMVLLLLIFGARLLVPRQLVSGSFPMSAQHSAAGRPAASRPGRASTPPAGPPEPRRDDRRRASRPPWEDADPWYDAARDREQRPGREQRDSRDDRDWRQGRRPDRRAGEPRDDDRRPGPPNAPADSGEPPTRVDFPRPGRDSRDSRDPRGGTPRSGRGSWDRRDPRGR